MTPAIKTPRLLLEPLTVENFSDYSEWLNDPEVVKYSRHKDEFHTRDSCLHYVKSFDHKKDHIWKIEFQGLWIGNITVIRDEFWGYAEVGILIGNRRSWGHGYGQEAWTAVILHLVKVAIDERIIAGCHIDNKAMRHIISATMNCFADIENNKISGELKLR